MGLKLEDVSPMAAMMTGEGAMGKLISQGVGGAIPAMIARSAQRDSAEDERQKTIAASAPGASMKKGGSVSSASKRADGIAQRGKTRGRLV
jgi:hypothetical protein